MYVGLFFSFENKIIFIIIIITYFRCINFVPNMNNSYLLQEKCATFFRCNGAVIQCITTVSLGYYCAYRAGNRLCAQMLH